MIEAPASRPKQVLIVDDEPAARSQLRDVIASVGGLEVAAELGNGEAAVRAISELKPDIVFLDIDMPGMDGFAVAEATRDVSYQLVFLTAHHDYALEAFDTHAIDYLLKPARPSSIEKCLAKILRQEVLTLDTQSSSPTSSSLILTDSGISRVVDSQHIVFVEGLGRYRRLHLSADGVAVHKLATLLSDTTLEEFCRQLPEPGFMRVHRSYVVNLSHVVSLTTSGRRCELIVEGVKDGIPVARARAKELRKAMNELF